MTIEKSDYRKEFESRFPTLSFDFVAGMEKIGQYGLQKYKEESMDAKFRRGDFSRSPRTEPQEIARHAHVHMLDAIENMPHDHFGDVDSNLFAAAFNSLMEYRLRNKK